MKVTILLPLLVLLSFMMHAQSDDYCSCMETDNEQNELAELLIELTNQRPLWQTPPPNYHLNQAPPPPVQPMTIMVSEEIAEEANEAIEAEQEDTDKELIDNELDKEETIEKSDIVVNKKRSLKVSGKTKRSKAKVKRKAKRLKGKLKKRKKMRKYKGGCPGF